MKNLISKELFALSYIMVLFLVLVSDAHAYLDPGFGNYLLQLIISAFLGVVFTVKIFWYRIITFFKGVAIKKDTKNND